MYTNSLLATCAIFSTILPYYNNLLSFSLNARKSAIDHFNGFPSTAPSAISFGHMIDRRTHRDDNVSAFVLDGVVSLIIPRS